MDVDIVVSGGGLTGSATALALSSKGFRVLVIEPKPPAVSQERLGFDLRSIALSPANVDWLCELKVASSDEGQPIERMNIWEEDGSASLTFSSDSVGSTALAWVFDHGNVVRRSYDSCRNMLEVRENAHIVAVDSVGQQLTLSNGVQVSCHLLVIAEGQRSSTAKLVDSGQKAQELGQMSLVTVARTSRPHRNTAWQKFHNGVLALLPLTDSNTVSVIWSMESERCRELLELNDSDFASYLESSTEQVCGTVEDIERRASFPLTHAIVNTMNPKPWVVIIGDAAHTIHPLAGHGVNLGVEDGRALASQIEKTDIASLSRSSLSRFAIQRRTKALMTMQLMSCFLNVWGWSGPSSRWIRNLGIRAFDRTGFIKNQVIREAMGIGHWSFTS